MLACIWMIIIFSSFYASRHETSPRFPSLSTPSSSPSLPHPSAPATLSFPFPSHFRCSNFQHLLFLSQIYGSPISLQSRVTWPAPPPSSPSTGIGWNPHPLPQTALSTLDILLSSPPQPRPIHLTYCEQRPVPVFHTSPFKFLISH